MGLVLYLVFVAGSLGLLYEPSLYSANATLESDRLRAQVAMSWYKEGPWLREVMGGYASARGKFHILEIGCGPGHFSERLLESDERVWVTCVEANKEFIEMSNK